MSLSARPPRIACLAWGSLVWKAGPLVLATGWQVGGPPMPIEFCRAADDGELATAVWPEAAPVPTRWALLRATTLAEARDQLRRREGIDEQDARCIGDAPGGDASLPGAQAIVGWAAARGIDHVVWTALPARFDGEEGRAPTAREAVAYLDGLRGGRREHAEHYVRCAPAEIRTPHRAAIEARLGWTPLAPC